MDDQRDLKVSDLMKMQVDLWEKYREAWDPMEAKYGRHSLLWMIEEIGEVIAIIKKKGDGAIMENSIVRQSFLEELSDVIMYFIDTLLRYGITPHEISGAYIKKHIYNMERDYKGENDRLLSGSADE